MRISTARRSQPPRYHRLRHLRAGEIFRQGHRHRTYSAHFRAGRGRILSLPAADKRYGALIQLDDHGRIALDSLSIERRGGLVFVFINGRPVTELQIDQRVSDGKIYIASGLTAADIALMKKDWRLIGQRKK